MSAVHEPGSDGSPRAGSRSRRLTRAAVVTLAVLVVSVLTACVVPWPLAVGDRARPLDVQWLQGTPVDPTHADGQLVVVELWATWCGPCLGAIPELDALQRRYAGDGVRVVAVAVDDDLARVQQFVEERGRDLAYAIAFDVHGTVGRQWREHWSGNGIPRSFVLGRDGRVACITHPLGLDQVLAQLLDGTWQPGDADEDLWEQVWDAERRGDWAAVADCGERLRARRPKGTGGWVVSVRACRTVAGRTAMAARALAALDGDATRIGWLVRGLARDGALQPCAAAAAAVLAQLPARGRGLDAVLARLHLAHALGTTALDACTAELCRRFADQPSELLAVTRAVTQWRVEDVAGLTLHPDRRQLEAAALRCLDAAADGLPPRHLGPVRFELLVATAADAARIEAAGAEVVAGLAADVTALNSFAWQLLIDPEHLAATRSTALRAAEAMARIKGWEAPATLDTAALAHFENGDIDGAIQLQRRAIAGNEKPGAAYLERLRRYEQAKGQAGTGR